MTHRIAKLALACLLPLFFATAFAANPTATPAVTSAANATTKPAAPARAPRPTITIINLNTADAATLARDMDGIGETKARAIVEHRKSKGAFRSVDELALVKGIGSKTLERNRPRLTVGSPAPVSATQAPTKQAPQKHAPASATRPAPATR